jgi:MFS family permease
MLGTGTPSGTKTLQWIDDKIFSNTLAEKLQQQKARRLVAIAGSVFSLGFGFIFGYAAWSFIAPNPVSTLEKFLSGLFWVNLFLCFQIPPLVQMAVGSVVALPGQTIDERQRQLLVEARSNALGLVQVLLLVLIAVGICTLIALIAGYLPWTQPVYGGLPFFVGFCGTIFMAAALSPYLLLAWQMPDEVDIDGEP